MTKKVTITVKQGKIRGFETKTAYSEATYYSFLGVPYGQSTAGSARYKDPIAAKPWSNILDTTRPKDGCTQFSLQKKNFIGSEDCLYNNIHTPKIPSKGDPLKAVKVNIHPGGWFHGTPDPDHYGAADFIMHQDVVYVCTGFRLHAFGFLNLHTKACSGNQGLKDLILSLKWIKENIGFFGGDPNNVTLMGSSSGAAIVHYLLLSPMAHGLYHKAILMGNYVFTPVATKLLDHAALAYDVAKMMGYENEPGDNKKLLNFYKNLEFEQFSSARTEHYFNKTALPVYPSSPFMSTPERGVNSPVPLSPRELIPSTNRVPIIIGICEREACMAIGLLRTLKKSISDCFYKAIHQNEIGWAADLNEDQLKLIQKDVENFYLAGAPIETADQSTLCDILTDAAWSDVYESLINVISADLPSSVYVYKFQYDGKLCVLRNMTEKLMEKELRGSFHSADYSYWCYTELAGKTMANIQPSDRQIIETLTKLFTTFAKTSDPNYEGMMTHWKPSTPENPSYLIIDEMLQSKDELLNGERMQFWHKLKQKYQNNE